MAKETPHHSLGSTCHGVQVVRFVAAQAMVMFHDNVARQKCGQGWPTFMVGRMDAS